MSDDDGGDVVVNGRLGGSPRPSEQLPIRNSTAKQPRGKLEIRSFTFANSSCGIIMSCIITSSCGIITLRAYPVTISCHVLLETILNPIYLTVGRYVKKFN